MSKPRVLCLHGFTSNGSVHAQQVRSITNALSADFDFLFPDGPHEVDMSKQINPEDTAAKLWSDYVLANSTSGHRAWWFARDADPANNQSGGFHGLERSLDYLGDLIQKTGPVHVIWGFSQGACFAGMLISLLSDGLKDHPLRRYLPVHQGMPSAGVFYSGFKARFPQYDSVYALGIDIPTLHILGERDNVVSAKRSETLIRVCRDGSVLRHAGEHEIPTSTEDHAVIIRFLRDKVRSGIRILKAD
jgi:pimeloyl-ACP methyl ester carboxylesterase